MPVDMFLHIGKLVISGFVFANAPYLYRSVTMLDVFSWKVFLIILRLCRSLTGFTVINKFFHLIFFNIVENIFYYITYVIIWEWIICEKFNLTEQYLQKNTDEPVTIKKNNYREMLTNILKPDLEGITQERHSFATVPTRRSYGTGMGPDLYIENKCFETMTSKGHSDIELDY